MRFIFFISHTEGQGNVELSSVLTELISGKLSRSSDSSVKINGKLRATGVLAQYVRCCFESVSCSADSRECWHDPNKLTVLHYSILQRKHTFINTGTRP